MKGLSPCQLYSLQACFPAAVEVCKLFPTWTHDLSLSPSPPYPPPLPRKIDLDGRLATHEPWWSLSSLLAVRRGSSDPHKGAARVRRGAGRRHPHGLQRFQLPALRPLLVRDQQREQPVIALAGCQRDVFTPTFSSCALWGQRQHPASPLAPMLDMLNHSVPLSAFFQFNHLHSRFSQLCMICRCFFCFYWISFAVDG